MPKTKFVKGNPKKIATDRFNELVRIHCAVERKTMRELAEVMQISLASMYHKCQGKNEWKLGEMVSLVFLLHFTREEIASVFGEVVA